MTINIIVILLIVLLTDSLIKPRIELLSNRRLAIWYGTSNRIYKILKY